MSDESPYPQVDDARQDRRSGEDRRQGPERRRETRGIWNLPILGRLLDRRKGGDRRSGAERRQG
jgi:hypothetical protein